MVASIRSLTAMSDHHDHAASTSTSLAALRHISGNCYCIGFLVGNHFPVSAVMYLIRC